MTRPVRSAPLAIALVVVVAAGGAMLWLRANPLGAVKLGDRGQVTATVDRECRRANIKIGGLSLVSTSRPSPPLKHATVRGRLILTDAHDLDGEHGGVGVSGTFTPEGGRSMKVSGGTDGKVFFAASCAIWADPDLPTPAPSTTTAPGR